MDSCEFHNRVTLCKARMKVCRTDFSSLLRTHDKRAQKVFRNRNAHHFDKLKHYGKHAILDVEVDGVWYQMLQHPSGARLCTQSVGLSASSQQVTQRVVVRYHTFKQRLWNFLSECWRMACPLKKWRKGRRGAMFMS